MLHESDRKKLHTDEEEEEGQKEVNGNQESDETGEGKTEELDPNEGRKKERQNDEDDKEEEKEIRRRVAKRGKQPMSKLGMSKEGRQLDADYHDYDYDYHQNLAILRTIWDYKSKTGDFPNPPSIELLDFIMYSLPNLKISREKLAKKIITFKNNYNDAWELDGDNPDLDRPVDREIFNLSMRLWGEDFMMTGNGNSEENNVVYARM
ncbi:hypothetical protein R3W88_020724 [Solanum pinnatisectum]|uniref:Glabrous enhancer-binding protein-like DBD domain-containing protein n=1 Tax=Solanum pinnatisectum TaxID=50273 RepID=A0AAV9KN49_9SOLN|nr:hypothetical protein R3W88_020724 [Solanum pinnatisectum]